MWPADREFRPTRHLVVEEDMMPLTNAPDDSDYVADPEKTDVEFLRHEAAYQISARNTEVGNRLSEIANRLEQLEQLSPPLAPERPRELADFRGRGQTARRPPTDNATGVTEYPLELTQEMSLPPDFKPSPLRLWEVENNRDLVAEIRGEIRNAHENGHDVLANRSNHQVMCDLKECTGDYLDVPEDAMVEAIAYVRKQYDKR